ncbi:hypothetical protein BZG36_01535 [Bifiguratus adelaidae]|uniref:Peptide hydrolase n=1 Tax=Bifiguratus adelaidae TaxID=1938954 RepID=A0A261Y403_9FUNG|nr:hypothetical protein BZG36_01535 [Bifiguratus adelaidae]
MTSANSQGKNKRFDREGSLGETASLWSILLVLGLFASAVFIGVSFHYDLPKPMPVDAVDPVTQLPVFSEYKAMETIKWLADDLGYRIVGTLEEKQSADYILQQLSTYKRLAEKTEGGPKFDIWVQRKSGSHRFDIMDHMVLKLYTDITNVIVRLSCSDNHPSCSKDAVLLNSHFDTTLGSPGAADDAAGVAVMLEIIRVLVQENWDGKKNAVVFLFNGAEETLQDASHAFITTHELKDSIRSVINLEACGTTGREILFQANSREMIDAYRHVPYPHGAVMANDVFLTGLIMSDTDFRQFVLYANLTGLDMALYKNSYVYHTDLDKSASIAVGAIQHMGENTLALVRHLIGDVELGIPIEKASDVVYFDVFGLVFIVYSWNTARLIQLGTAAVAFAVFLYIFNTQCNAPPYRSRTHHLVAYIFSTLAVIVSIVVSLVAPNAVAFLLTGVLNRPMSYFRQEWFGAMIYGPAAIASSLAVQYVLSLAPVPHHPNPEYGAFVSTMLTWAILTVLVTRLELASSYVSWLYLFILLVAVGVNEAVALFNRYSRSKDYLKGDRRVFTKRVYLLGYVASVFPLALLYTDYTCALVDIFVPLTGRMGPAPTDNIVSVIYGMVTYMICPALVAFAQRFGQRGLRNFVLFFAGLQVLAIVAVVILGGEGSYFYPFDYLHPKRVFVQHMKNMTSGEAHVYIAEADQGPFFTPIIPKLEEALGQPAEHRVHETSNTDWDSVYPFSAFLSSYRIDAGPYIRQETNDKHIAASTGSLAPYFDFPLPHVEARNITYDPITRQRSFTVACHVPSYTWTVISFDAHVLDWSIGNEEPLNYTSHYVVRNVNGYGSQDWQLDLAIRVPDDADPATYKLRAEFTAMDKEGFAAHGDERLIGGVRVLQRVKEVLPNWTTGTWLGSVVGVWEL